MCPAVAYSYVKRTPSTETPSTETPSTETPNTETPCTLKPKPILISFLTLKN